MFDILNNIFTENIRYPFKIFPEIGTWGTKYLKHQLIVIESLNDRTSSQSRFTCYVPAWDMREVQENPALTFWWIIILLDNAFHGLQLYLRNSNCTSKSVFDSKAAISVWRRFRSNSIWNEKKGSTRQFCH